MNGVCPDEGGVSQHQTLLLAAFPPRPAAPEAGTRVLSPEHQARLALLCSLLPSTQQHADDRASRWVQVWP